MLDVDVTRFKELIDAAGHEPRSYSGRGMYGQQCLGVTCGSVLGLFADLLQAITETGEEPGQLEELIELMRDARTDNMGMDMIVYWPEVPYVDDEDDEEEDEEESSDEE